VKKGKYRLDLALLDHHDDLERRRHRHAHSLKITIFEKKEIRRWCEEREEGQDREGGGKDKRDAELDDWRRRGAHLAVKARVMMTMTMRVSRAVWIYRLLSRSPRCQP